jgi:DNA polymerase I-like protein with 3'-5' exonuclease and polymerase domains
MYYKFRNYLNNSKNFPIQATAAHVCNAALIKLSRLFKKNKIDGWIALQVHDEITCIVREDQAEFASELLKESMEKNVITERIDIPILAEPIIADSLADAKD